MILLETHAYYWFIMDDPHLPASVKRIIETEEMVFVSSVSFWEMTIKSSLGKMELPADITAMMSACEEMGIMNQGVWRSLSLVSKMVFKI